MSRAGCIMVQGTMSGAGKSLLCAALCRIFAQDGYKTAPFKSQNMALNSFVTRDGLEMGRAQVVQAQAAGVEPDVRMNPILLKPSSDVGSQVIVNGEVRGNMPAKEYFRRKKSLIPDILRAGHRPCRHQEGRSFCRSLYPWSGSDGLASRGCELCQGFRPFAQYPDDRCKPSAGSCDGSFHQGKR